MLQPHADDVASLLVLIAEAIPRVQQGVVVDEDHVAWLCAKDKLALISDLFDLLERLVLELR
jgi:hypothetical protein